MEEDLFDRMQRLSIELTKNNVLLPVAASLLDIPGSSGITAPAVCQALHGRLPVNRILDVLRRLARVGVLVELPYPGRPHPRLFSRVEGPFWVLVESWVADESIDCAASR